VDEALRAEEQLVAVLRDLRTASVDAHQPVSLEDRRSLGWTDVELGDFLNLVTDVEDVTAAATYEIAGVYSFGRGLIDRGELLGSQTSYKTLGRLAPDMVVISKLGAWEGAVAVADEAFADFFVSAEFPRFAFHSDLTTAAFFRGLARSPSFWEAIDAVTRGSMARRKRTTPEQFLRTRLWLPPTPEQERSVRRLALIDQLVEPRRIAGTREAALAASAFDACFAR
jgi:type I restriction enzyme S subunit